MDPAGRELKQGIKMSDLIAAGTTFSFDTGDMCEYSDEEEGFMEHPEVEDFKLPFEMAFDKIRELMCEELEGVWKKTYGAAKADAVSVDFTRHRVKYHRSLYMENQDYPFDSTFMNGKADIICYDTEKYLPGLIEALSTMKSGEKAYFIISYKKMFKEEGCPPRVLPRADILCDLSVLEAEEIGREESIQKLTTETNEVKSFAEIKTLADDGRLRAKDLFKQQQYKEAVSIYKNILHALNLCKTSGGEEQKELSTIKVQVLANIVTCHNLREKPKEALTTIAVIEAICDISDNPKILFAKAKALRLNGDYNEARDVLKKVYPLHPMNSDIRGEMKKLAAAVEKYVEISWKLP